MGEKTFSKKYFDGDYYRLMDPETRRILDLVNKYGAPHYEEMVVAIKTSGEYMFNPLGENITDYLAGYSSILYHNDPKIQDTLKHHMSSNNPDLVSGVVASKEYANICERLCRFTGYDKVLFKSDGGSSTDTAIKGILRHGRARGVEDPEIIVCENYFHGRTHIFSSHATFDPNQQVNLPKPSKNLVTIPFNNPEAFADAINQNTVGVFMEVHQGEGGPLFSDRESFIEIRKVAKEHDLIFGLDEIQTGLGRCGYVMAWHEYINPNDVELRPDFVTLGKALGAGMIPVSAVVGTREFIDIYGPGTEGCTYGGYPLASVVATKSLELIEEDKICEKAIDLGEKISNVLKESKIQHDHRGALFRLELPGVSSSKPACYEMLYGEKRGGGRAFVKYGHTEETVEGKMAYLRLAPVIKAMSKYPGLVEKTISGTIVPILKEAIGQEVR